MAKKTWAFEIEGEEHTVELEHKAFSGRRIIRVDGNLLENHSELLDVGKQYPFQIGGHEGVVHVQTNGFTFNYDLSIDGRSVDTGKEVVPASPIPGWAWIFVVVCALIPILSLGGAIPAAIGFGGAYGCIAIARDLSKSVNMRIGLCVGISILCWVLYFALAIGISAVS